MTTLVGALMATLVGALVGALMAALMAALMRAAVTALVLAVFAASRFLLQVITVGYKVNHKMSISKSFSLFNLY